MSTLQLGDAGSEVTDLQDRLYQLGYQLYGGGEYDVYTEEAVRRFQSDSGLESTGIVDEVTLTQLGQYGESFPATDAAAAGSDALTPGQAARVVNAAGEELATGTVQSIQTQGEHTEMASPAREVAERLLGLHPLTAPIPLALDLVNSYGFTVAVGVDGDVIVPVIGPAGFGLTGGGGVYFAPGDTWGLYFSLGADAGLAMGVSGGSCFTAVKGGSDALAGTFWALEFSGGEGFGGGLALLFNSSFEWVGVSGELSVCIGYPENFFGSWSYTFLQPLP